MNIENIDFKRMAHDVRTHLEKHNAFNEEDIDTVLKYILTYELDKYVKQK